MFTICKSYFSVYSTVSLILLLSFTHNALGQVKDEKEERVDISSLPTDVQQLVKQLPKDCKRIKFYKEEDGSKSSYEVKFKFKKAHYSLEFSTNGILEDIEVSAKLKKIDENIRSNIKDYFNQSFANYKVIKLQEQYIYDTNKTSIGFVELVLFQRTELSANFEIIAEVKKDNQRTLREFTFNTVGTYLNSRILTPTSYEHVLY